MSDTTDAFLDLLDAQEEAASERLKATVGTIVNADAIVGEITRDAIEGAGGNSDSGGFELQMLRSLFPAGRAALNAFMDEQPDATAKGSTHKVLRHVENNGVLILTCGDPTEEII